MKIPLILLTSMLLIACQGEKTIYENGSYRMYSDRVEQGDFTGVAGQALRSSTSRQESTPSPSGWSRTQTTWTSTSTISRSNRSALQNFKPAI